MARIIDAVIRLKDNLSPTLKTTQGNLKTFDKKLNDMGKSAGRIGRDISKTGKSITKLGNNMMKVATPIIGVGVASTKMAMDFEESMANIDTLLDDHSHLKAYEQQVLKVSKETGMSLKTVGEGMYTAVSSLGDGKEVKDIFKTMADAAKAGGSEVNDSVALISAAMKGYGSINDKTAKKISDLAFQTAKLGVTTFPEMAKSMQPLFPLAKNLNFSYEELFGSMATLTGVTGNTSEVSTQLKAVFSNMMKPTKQMSALMQKYGFSNAQAMVKSKGLAGTIDILKKETGGQADKMSKLFSSTEAVTAIMALTGANYDDLIKKTKEMEKATGATDKALRKVSNTTKDKFNKAINNLKVSATELGAQLLPLVTKITDKIGKLVERFNNLTPEQQKTIVNLGLLIVKATLFIVILGKVTKGIGDTLRGFRKFTNSVKNAGGIMNWLTSPGMKVVAIILLIIGIVYILYRAWTENWGGIQEKTRAVVDFIKNKIESIKTTFENVKNKCKEFKESILEMWNNIKEFLKHPIKGTVSLVKHGNLSGIKKDGSKAVGGKVPYNGYMAELHEDELVLNKQKAREYSEGKGNNNMPQIKIEHMEVRNDSDIEKVAEALARKLKIYQLNTT
ncbi:phage tail tape measure protein [Clostridium tetani]|uniref:phage tail tape measure protein n=1 Tax=Clostridium tetani TaxID=1513 RepID=UPI001027FD9F|nr:phage tail tape measure protein [Clostridium tetani]RXI70499.1 phage tail tape measure protein [Clostridium tetani]